MTRIGIWHIPSAGPVLKMLNDEQNKQQPSQHLEATESKLLSRMAREPLQDHPEPTSMILSYFRTSQEHQSYQKLH